MWGCWALHWRQAIEAADGQAVPGEEVAARVRGGRGYQGGGDLGGDPFRDIVLAHGVCGRLGRATEKFIDEYRPSMLAVACRKRADLRNSDDWWSDLMDRLAGYTRPKGKLLSFAGRCALKHYLPRVVSNFVYDLPQPIPSMVKEFDTGEQHESRRDTVGDDDCAALLRSRMQHGLESLGSDQRLVLALRYEQSLEWAQIAPMLGIKAAGSAKRRGDAAIKALGATIYDVPNEKKQQLAACVEALESRGVSTGLAEELREALSSTREQS
ncbi:MAG: sigma-70 family RNA polymerase sigma factor [Planctomycetales bacterium]|nr:sigma-70 family RNA polymerase sigma factor [Planctomycetales bacterium]